MSKNEKWAKQLLQTLQGARRSILRKGRRKDWGDILTDEQLRAALILVVIVAKLRPEKERDGMVARAKAELDEQDKDLIEQLEKITRLRLVA